MRSTGIVKTVDKIGRITIPPTLRREFINRFNGVLEVYVKNQNITLKKYESLGIARRIDVYKQISLPWEMRKTLNIKAGDNLEILIDGDEIILKKLEGAI